MTATLHWLWRSASDLIGDTHGVTAAIMAISMATLIGLAGLGVETGFWFSEKRHYQTAVDAAAMSGAFQLASQIPNLKCNGKASNPSGYMTSVQKIATTAATSNSYGGSTAISGTPPATSATEALYVNNPPVNAGTYQGNNCAVEAVIYEPKKDLLAAVSQGSGSTVTIAAYAVALINFNFGGGACALSLNAGAAPTGTGNNAGISVGGTSTLSDPNCLVASNSTDNCAIDTNGTPHVTVSDFYAVGGDCVGSNTTFNSGGNLVPVSGGDPIPDPFASDFTNSSTGSMPNGSSCPSSNDLKSSSATNPITPGTYKSIQLSSAPPGGGAWIFGSGTYYICANNTNGSNGEFKVTSGVSIETASGGATFIVAGTVDIEGSTPSGQCLCAPTSNATSTPYPGIVIYQPGVGGNNPPSDTIGGSSTVTMSGAIYAPGGNVSFNGGPTSTNGCLELVAYVINFSGNSTLTNTGCTGGGGPGDINVTNITLAQ